MIARLNADQTERYGLQMRSITTFWRAGSSLVLALAIAGNCPAQTPELKPFYMDWSKAAESVVSNARFLTGPAGKDGFVTMKGERMLAGNGQRFRIWGMNLAGPDCFPDKEQAGAIADDFARMGINCIRFHHMDNTWGRNLFDSKSDNTRKLNEDSLDRLDFFIDQLRQRGIYANLNLNVSRQFRSGDEVRDYKILGYAKGSTYFNPRLVELQHELARQFLTHRNPYTGHEYRAEPAVACVEIVNENSLTEAWVWGRLIGSDAEKEKKDATWGPIPVSYAEELTDQYNAWLKKTVSKEDLETIRKEAGVDPGNGRVPRLSPKEFAKASKARFQNEARFLMETEVRFFSDFRKLLTEEIGIKQLVIGSADHNDSISGYPHILSNMSLDVVDGHGYWEHPRTSPETWIKNTPMVNDPLDSTYTQFARTPVVGRPFTISEVNHPFPHEFAAEGFPILTAYALFADWDAIYWFTYGSGRNGDPASKGIRGHFDFSNDPVKMTNLMACAGMWWRQDIARAKQTVIRSYTTELVIESLRMERWKQRPFFDKDFPRSVPLEHATRWQWVEKEIKPEYPPAADLGAIIADTGELKWLGADKKLGAVTIDTGRSQGIIGFLDQKRSTGRLGFEGGSRFGSVLLTSLDDKEIGQSKRLLLSATGKATNSGFEWKADHQTVAKMGKGPVLIEPVAGTLKVKLAGSWKCRALTAEGRVAGEVAVKELGDGNLEIGLGAATTWYLLEMK